MAKIINMGKLQFGVGNVTHKYHFVRIDRGSSWGNPFIIGRDGSRKEVIRLYREYALWRLSFEPNWLEELRGRDLACWCAPEMCHGNVILELLGDIEEM